MTIHRLRNLLAGLVEQLIISEDTMDWTCYAVRTEQYREGEGKTATEKVFYAEGAYLWRLRVRERLDGTDIYFEGFIKTDEPLEKQIVNTLSRVAPFQEREHIPAFRSKRTVERHIKAFKDGAY